MALPKANRLTSRQDFQAVFRQGIRRQGPHLTLRALRSKADASDAPDTGTETQPPSKPHLTPTRIGISISTKVSKRAVIRNRMKRQLQGAFLCLLPKLSPGWRLVVVVQPSAVQEKCDYQQFLQELEQLLVKAEVFNGHS